MPTVWSGGLDNFLNESQNTLQVLRIAHAILPPSESLSCKELVPVALYSPVHIAHSTLHRNWAYLCSMMFSARVLSQSVFTPRP